MTGKLVLLVLVVTGVAVPILFSVEECIVWVERRIASDANSISADTLRMISDAHVDRVHNVDTEVNYTTIQAAIDAPETLDGHTIFVEKGTYYENVVVNKSVSLVGEDRTSTIIDGNRTGIVILVSAHNVTVRGFTVQNGTTGIYVDHSNDSTVMKNDVVGNVDAISINVCNNCTIRQNLAGNNAHRGILITNSWNFTVTNNTVYGSGWYGINANASANGIIAQNNVYENNFDGIGLLGSSNCTIAENNVIDNTLFGVWLDSSHESFVYHNNFINNSVQATCNTLTNRWDNGLEGNYWSNYAGTDHDRDGIGDVPYVSSEVEDDFPLMGLFQSFSKL
jgi:parallel beta-helix repeat protein